MKNKTSTQTYSASWRRHQTNGTTTNGTLTGPSNVEVVVSSTNTTQNKGDHVRGTAFSYSVDKSPLAYGYQSFKYPSGETYACFGSFQNVGSALSFHSTDAADANSMANAKATEDFYEKLRGDVDLSVDAFQISQTLNMLKNPLGIVTKFAKQAKKRAKKEKREIGDIWLELQYGWGPAVSTAYGIADQVGKGASTGIGQIFKGKGHDSKSFTNKVSRTVGGFSMDGSYTIKHNASCTVYGLVNMDDESIAQTAAHYSSLNPASIAWELLPYSFVVDWFVGIGSYIRTVESACLYGSLVSSSWKSSLIVTTESTVLTSMTNPSLSGGGEVTSSRSKITFTRTKIVGSPKPSRITTGPILDQSWKRYASAVALLRNAFR